MVLVKRPPACVGAVALCLSLAPVTALAESHAQTAHALSARAAAANPYRLVTREIPSSATTVIARWTEPPTFAIAPRTIGITLDSSYFERSAYAGPPQRGRAYNVRRKSS